MMEPTPPPTMPMTSSTSGAPSLGYCLSINALLKSLEMLFGVIVCFCAGLSCRTTPCSSGYYEVDDMNAKGQGYVLFTVGVATMFVFIFWFIHFFTAENPLGRNFVKQMEGLFYFSFGVLMLIAAIVESVYATIAPKNEFMAPYRSQWIAAALFLWFDLFLFIYDLYRQFQARRE